MNQLSPFEVNNHNNF